MSESKETIVFDELVKETSLAWLLRFDKEVVSLPKSRCTLDEDGRRAEVPMWLIVQQGLEAYIED